MIKKSKERGKEISMKDYLRGEIKMIKKSREEGIEWLKGQVKG